MHSTSEAQHHLSWTAASLSTGKEPVCLSSQVEEETYELQTVTVVTVTTATGATPAASATTGKVRAASPTCCLFSTHEVEVVEVEVEVEG